MEAYKKSVQWRVGFCAVVVALSLALGILAQSGWYDRFSFVQQNEVIAGFQLGLLFGFGIITFLLLLRYASALRDQTKLKMLYNQEHDERTSLIRQKAGMPMLMVTSGLMIFVGILLGYVNEMVFYTLVGAAAVQLLLSLVVKIYCLRTM